MKKNKYTSIIYVFLVFLMLGITNESKATHIMGGDFSYVCQSNGVYALNLRLFRDCNGISLGSTAFVTLSSPTCGNVNVTLSNLGGPIDRTPYCPGEQSACDGGSGTYGIQEYFYRGTVTLPGNCNNWTMSWSSCCRNFAITTLSNPGSEGMYIDAQLDATICNNSPAFNNDPTFFLCANQENRYNFGAVDTEGDSLVYSFINCRNNGPASYVAYNSPLSGTNPLVATTQTLNSESGEIIIVPTTAQIGVICIKVEEYRSNQKIGEITRDLQFTVTDCATNSLPILSGINGTADSTGYTGAFSIDVCANEQTSLLIQGFDGEAVPSVQLQNLELEWNYGIPGASFIVDYNLPYPVGEFKWVPTSSDVGRHYFFVAANDDACPILGSNIFAYQVNVLSSLTADINMISSVDTLNTTNGDTAVLEVSTNISSPDHVYTWTPTTGLSCTDCPSPDAYPQVTTTYTVTIFDPLTGCSTSEEIEVPVYAVTTDKIPQTLSSWNIYPNPVEGHSILSYELSDASQVTIEIFDILGKQVGMITDERQSAGEYQYSIGQYLKNHTDGIYFVSMQIDGQRVTKKLIVR